MSSYLSQRFNYEIFHSFSCILHHLRVYYELTKGPAPSWLDSSVGRALHRYHRGHTFDSRSSLHVVSGFVLVTAYITGKLSNNFKFSVRFYLFCFVFLIRDILVLPLNRMLVL